MKKINKDVYELAKKLEKQAIKNCSHWTLVPVWGVFRDMAERKLGKSLFASHPTR